MSNASSFDMVEEEEKQRDENQDHLTDSEQDNQTELGGDELETDIVMELKKQLETMKAEKDELAKEVMTLKFEKMLIILPMNRWNGNDCHAMFINKNSPLVVQRYLDSRDAYYWTSVHAEMMMPRHCQGIFYFEVTIIGKKCIGDLMVGLAPQSLKPTTAICKYEDFAGCYLYNSYGQFLGHRVGGCKYYGSGNVPYVGEKPMFGAGDVVGCGVNLATRQIIYTKNGKRIDTANLIVCESDLFPFVALLCAGDVVEANFGNRRFLYDFAKELADESGNLKD